MTDTTKTPEWTAPVVWTPVYPSWVVISGYDAHGQFIEERILINGPMRPLRRLNEQEERMVNEWLRKCSNRDIHPTGNWRKRRRVARRRWNREGPRP